MALQGSQIDWESDRPVCEEDGQVIWKKHHQSPRFVQRQRRKEEEEAEVSVRRKQAQWSRRGALGVHRGE